MPFRHFSRVYKGTALADLKAKEQLRISGKCKEVEYTELISIVVDQEEFDQLCNDISSARSCYQNYAHQSTATLDGKWKCIIIKNQHNEQRIILYTAGRMFPLYAAFSE